MKKIIAILALAAVSVAGCSSSIHVDDAKNGNCIQKREKHFLGITYSKAENLVSCDNEAG